MSWQNVRVPLMVLLSFCIFTLAILGGSTQESAPVWRRLLIPVGFASLLLPFWIAAMSSPGGVKKRYNDRSHIEHATTPNGERQPRVSVLPVIVTVSLGLVGYWLFAGSWTLGASVFVLYLFLAAVWLLRR